MSGDSIFDLSLPDLTGVAIVDEPALSKEEREKAEMSQYDVAKEDTTCWNCPENKTCKVAWDAYNTDGDCLNK